MKIITFVLYLLFFTGTIHGQTFVVFKGDTINRKDIKGLKQGVWKKFYRTDSLFSVTRLNNKDLFDCCAFTEKADNTTKNKRIYF